MNFYDAWWFLFNHKMFKDRCGESCFEFCTDMMVVKVNPSSRVVEDRQSLNTHTQVWLETGELIGRELSHDIDLDCGGDTYEEAIIELARLVKENYGG